MQPVAIDHFKHYQFPANLRSNGAGAVTFVTKRANLRQDRYDSRLWLWQNGTLQALTAWGELDNYWWQDETTLLLARPGDDTDRARRAKGLPRTVLQRLSLNTPGEAEDFLRLDLDVENIECLPGGRLLLVAVYSARVEAALAEAGDDTDPRQRRDAVVVDLATVHDVDDLGRTGLDPADGGARQQQDEEDGGGADGAVDRHRLGDLGRRPRAGGAVVDRWEVLGAGLGRGPRGGGGLHRSLVEHRTRHRGTLLGASCGPRLGPSSRAYRPPIRR